MTKIALALAAMCLICAPAQAQTGTCKLEASNHKPNPLAGAALTSFMQKCEKDATASCEKEAADHKPNPLAGAAKTSFVTKCVKDKVGT
jgi:hypothetical protein